MGENIKNKSAFGTAGMVLGIIAASTCLIPIINNLSFFMGILAAIFGVISLIKKASKGKAIAAVILGILAIVLTLNAQAALSNALNEFENAVGDDLSNLTGDNTDSLLENNVKVEFGKVKVTSSYGYYESELKVKVTNISSKRQSFSIQLEAVASNGNRIETDYLYVTNLAAGQSQEFKAFNLVSSEVAAKLKKATFKVVEVSMY